MHVSICIVYIYIFNSLCVPLVSVHLLDLTCLGFEAEGCRAGQLCLDPDPGMSIGSGSGYFDRIREF